MQQGQIRKLIMYGILVLLQEMLKVKVIKQYKKYLRLWTSTSYNSNQYKHLVKNNVEENCKELKLV